MHGADPEKYPTPGANLGTFHLREHDKGNMSNFFLIIVFIELAYNGYHVWYYVCAHLMNNILWSLLWWEIFSTQNINITFGDKFKCTFNHTCTSPRVLQEPNHSGNTWKMKGSNLFQSEFRLTFPCFQTRSNVSSSEWIRRKIERVNYSFYD